MIKTIITRSLFLGFLFVLNSGCETGRDSEILEVKNLIQHNVYFYFNDDVTDEQKAQFEIELEKLLDISHIKQSMIGKPAATESRDVTDHDFDYSLFMWFDSVEDHDQYQIDPVHKQMVENFGQMFERVRVYDSQIFYENRSDSR